MQYALLPALCSAPDGEAGRYMDTFYVIVQVPREGHRLRLAHHTFPSAFQLERLARRMLNLSVKVRAACLLARDGTLTRCGAAAILVQVHAAGQCAGASQGAGASAARHVWSAQAVGFRDV